MGCFGHGHAKKFAEIIAATALAGEIAICARIANGTFVKGHKKYGRKPVRKRIDRWPFFIQTVIMNKVKTSPNNILLHVNRSTFWAGFVLCVYSFFMYTLFVIQSSEKVNLYSIRLSSHPSYTSYLEPIFSEKLNFTCEHRAFFVMVVYCNLALWLCNDLLVYRLPTRAILGKVFVLWGSFHSDDVLLFHR